MRTGRSRRGSSFGLDESERQEEDDEGGKARGAKGGVGDASREEAGDAEAKGDAGRCRGEDEGADVDGEVEHVGDVLGDEATEDGEGGADQGEFDDGVPDAVVTPVRARICVTKVSFTVMNSSKHFQGTPVSFIICV